MDPAPNLQYVFLNRTFNMWCPVKGAPAPYIVWRKDGDVVQNSTSITFELNITSKNNVNYSCEVRRDGEVLKRNISLRIEGEVSLFCWSISVLSVHILIVLTRTFLFAQNSNHLKERLNHFGCWMLFKLSKVIFPYPFNLTCMLFTALNANYWQGRYLLKGTA